MSGARTAWRASRVSASSPPPSIRWSMRSARRRSSFAGAVFSSASQVRARRSLFSTQSPCERPARVIKLKFMALDGYALCSRGKRDENIDFLDARRSHLPGSRASRRSKIDLKNPSASLCTSASAVGVLRSDAVYLNKGD